MSACARLLENTMNITASRRFYSDRAIEGHGCDIAFGAAVASQEVNLCLIPEVPFKLDSCLAALKERIPKRAHAVIVEAEGVGQGWLGNTGADRDASGNVKLADIGSFLRGQMEASFKAEKTPIVIRYFDPN